MQRLSLFKERGSLKTLLFQSTSINPFPEQNDFVRCKLTGMPTSLLYRNQEAMPQCLLRKRRYHPVQLQVRRQRRS